MKIKKNSNDVCKECGYNYTIYKNDKRECQYNQKEKNKVINFDGTSDYINLPFKESYCRSPYKCPICLGKGIVDGGFYNNTIGNCGISAEVTEPCRSCDGTGIVWG